MKPPSNAAQVGSVVTISQLSNEKFVIGRILRGGMGEVYQLVPVAIAHPTLALKTYQASADREQFIREAEIWISLGNHPHIATAFVYLEWQSKPSIISSWYKQATDSATAKAWSATKLIGFTARLIDALQHALAVGHVIHQDVKPANILLDDDDNPRLTDFGMARFSANHTPTITGFLDVDTSMSHSMMIGPVGGTPLYMAPELLGGEQPSIQTDIFSLGVTIYEMLTGEHPYCGPETGHRLRPSLRTEPLARVVNARGEDYLPLVALINAAVQIDVRKRPHTYEALLRFIGGEREAHGAVVGDSVGDVIVRAAFLRDTGRSKESLELLRVALKSRPVNPELINSYAIQLWKLGHKVEAYAAWKAAIDSLRLTNGRHEHKVYPDPAVNLAWRMVGNGEFAEADELLTLVNSWCRDSQRAISSYMELGWWHLYNGRFEGAWDHFVTCCESRAPDEMSLWSLTLAAWLSENFEQRVSTVGKLYLSMNNAGETTALLACIVAKCCSPQVRDNLVKIAYPKYEQPLAAIAKETGLQSTDWTGAIPGSVIRLVIRSLDVRVTGGRNIGTI